MLVKMLSPAGEMTPTFRHSLSPWGGWSVATFPKASVQQGDGSPKREGPLARSLQVLWAQLIGAPSLQVEVGLSGKMWFPGLRTPRWERCI